MLRFTRTSSKNYSVSCSSSSSSLFKTTPILFAESNRRRKHLARVSYDDDSNPLSKVTKIDKGVLYVVPTPIGNLKDFSLRSLETLRQVDYILCINRVATQVLLDLIDINASGRLIQYNKHLKSQTRLAELVKGGASAAMVCNQGTPVVGDQGGDVVNTFLKQGCRVSALPGPCAAISALTMSGALGSEDSFFFGGHLSQQRGVRLRQIHEAAVQNGRQPSVFYEAVPRLRNSLEELAALCPSRIVSVVHEVSKIHEATHRDTVERMCAFYGRASNRAVEQKGQATLIIDPDSEKLKAGKRTLSPMSRDENRNEKRRGQHKSVDASTPEYTMTNSSSLNLTTSTISDTNGNNNNNYSIEQQQHENEDDEFDNNPNVSFREKVIFRLVLDQFRKLSTNNNNNIKVAVVFVADEMKLERSDVWKIFRKVSLYYNNNNKKASSSSALRNSNKEKEGEVENNNNHDDEENEQILLSGENNNNNNNRSTKLQRILPPQSPGFARENDISSFGSIQTKNNDNNNSTQDSSSSSSETSASHFPDDWQLIGDSDGNTDDFNKNTSSSNNQTDGEEQFSSKSRTSRKKKLEQRKQQKREKLLRKLQAKKKMLAAIRTQAVKTRLARDMLNSEMSRHD